MRTEKRSHAKIPSGLQPSSPKSQVKWDLWLSHVTHSQAHLPLSIPGWRCILPSTTEMKMVPHLETPEKVKENDSKIPFHSKASSSCEKKDEGKETGYLNTEQFTTSASNSSDLSTQQGTSCSPGSQGFPSQGSDRAKSWTGQICTLHLGTAHQSCRISHSERHLLYTADMS